MKKTGSLAVMLILFVHLCGQISEIDMNGAMIKVFVTGAIEEPGVYRMYPGSRVSEVVSLMSAEEHLERTESLEQDEQFGPEVNRSEYSLRNVELRRKERVIYLDLSHFLVNGDLAENPELQDGDVLYFAAAEYVLEIQGEVNKPGRYEYRAGDRLSDLIRLAHGMKQGAFADSAELVRTDHKSGQLTSIFFDAKDLVEQEDAPQNIELQAGDRIYIRKLPSFESSFGVYVYGEARYPGEYAIEPGVTRLWDILEKSGGANKHGDLSRGWLQREPADTTLAIDVEYERLKALNLNDMNRIEKEYLKFKQRELEGKIVVDLSQCTAASSPIYLQDGDKIYIPFKPEYVEVSGSVMQPGAYKWKAGENYEYYIRLAGGYADRAQESKTRIILGESGTWQKRDRDLAMQAGDKIFVPEAEEISVWELAKDTLGIMAQLATVIIAVINISN